MPAHFQDPSGRTLLLHGVNLADGKLPKDQPSHLLSSLDASPSATHQTTYLDTPFALAAAPAHLARLRALGFTVLRLPVVWDALEHAGPGRYDEAYLAHVRALVALATGPAYGFRVLVNPHQDLWSRFAGGSGAPLWTLHACGLDPDGFAATHAAVRYAEWPAEGDVSALGGGGGGGGGKGDGEGEGGKQETPPSPQQTTDPKRIPPMMWTSNHNRLATSTLFALFWAGRDVAPRCVMEDGTNIQEYLQGHYFRAYERLAEVLGDLAWGWDSMNEPEPGFLEWQDLSKNEREASAMMGTAPTPIQAMRLGMGIEQEVDAYKLSKMGPRKDGTITIKPAASCWLKEDDGRWGWRRSEEWPLGTCVWAMHGVWDVETGELKKPDYFARQPDSCATTSNGHTTTTTTTTMTNETNAQRLDWKSTYWKEFFDKWVATIRTHCPKAITFIQTPVFEPPPPNLLSSLPHPERMAYSPHFYDALTIMKRHWHKHWNVDILSLLRGRQDISNKIKALRIGGKNVKSVISAQLGALATDVQPPLLNGQEKDEKKKEEEEKVVVVVDQQQQQPPKKEGERTANSKRSHPQTVTLPTLIGETGIPFDLDQGQAYRTGDYTNHVAALDAILSGCDDHLLNYTLWDYSAVNTHEWGDNWNGEDLSIYCAETATAAATGSPLAGHKYLSGFRAAAAWCRPHVQSLRGTPVRMAFDVKTSRFALEIEAAEEADGGDAVVYVPWLHYRKNGESDELDLKVDLSYGSWTLDTERTLLLWRYDKGGRLRLKLERAGGALSPRALGTVLSL